MGFAAAEGFFAMATELDVHDGVLLPHCLFFEFLPVDDDADDPDEEVKPLLLNQLEPYQPYPQHHSIYPSKIQILEVLQPVKNLKMNVFVNTW